LNHGRRVSTSNWHERCSRHIGWKIYYEDSLPPASLTSLISLTLGAFAIGTEGFMIAGLLPALARDLNVGVPAAGHLVTVFSLAYAIGASVMAVLTAGLERRRVLAVAMGCFTLANLLAALAPAMPGCWPRGCCWPCPPPPSCRRPADMPPHWAARSGAAALCPWSPTG
jgi:MFS family permease